MIWTDNSRDHIEFAREGYNDWLLALVQRAAKWLQFELNDEFSSLFSEGLEEWIKKNGESDLSLENFTKGFNEFYIKENTNE
jgi:hypothetical protein